MGGLSKNALIVLQDDDFILPYESLIRLRDGWIEDPKCFHTFFGRNPDANNEYADEVREGRAEICGRCYAIDRKLCGLILHEYWNLNEEQRALIHTKGDDILASYVVTHYTGQKHMVHNLPFQQLDESYALHYGKSRPVKPMTKQHESEMEEWFGYRTEMMRFCKRLYE